jgi:hypothetical protein
VGLALAFASLFCAGIAAILLLSVKRSVNFLANWALLLQTPSPPLVHAKAQAKNFSKKAGLFGDGYATEGNIRHRFRYRKIKAFNSKCRIKHKKGKAKV